MGANRVLPSSHPENTIIWYCSDNGGLPQIEPTTTGGLKGFKGSVWEGGLRVPSIIEWPSKIDARISDYPVFQQELPEREVSIPFRFRDQGALIDNQYKLIANSIEQQTFELFDLEKDPVESVDISMEQPDIFNEMKRAFLEWNASVDASIRVKDYPEGKVYEDHPEAHFWMVDPRYEPYLDQWVKIPEYESYILRSR